MAPLPDVPAHVPTPVVALRILRLVRPAMVAPVVVAYRRRPGIRADLERITTIPIVRPLAIEAVGSAAVAVLAEPEVVLQVWIPARGFLPFSFRWQAESVCVKVTRPRGQIILIRP